MDLKTKELIGIAASYAGNCEQCLAYHIDQGRRAGLTKQEIKIAIRIADIVKQASASFLDDLISETLEGFEKEQAA